MWSRANQVGWIQAHYLFTKTIFISNPVTKNSGLVLGEKLRNFLSNHHG